MSENQAKQPPAQSGDDNALLEANLERVFNERDAERRLAAIGDLYTRDAVLYEPDGAVSGHGAISDTVGKLLGTLGPGFLFTPDGAAAGHHGLGYARWTGGSKGGPVVVTDMDVGRFEGGRITALHVFIDPPKA
ncbi:MAG: hypothetical protein JWR47_1882 [Phenylobacterium sp.]|nr:hypothetical protein [Phenylobacterium sp.]